MPDSAAPRQIVRFGNFELDLTAGHLRKRGVKIRLREQSFEVLAILLAHAGEVVSRGDLRRRLWPHDVFVDFDNNLNSTVARLREALNDSAGRPRFIETLPKRGYRFIGRLSQPATRRPRLMVLPFANLSGDPAQEYFSDAITEEIISHLAGLAPEHLAVIARTTAMQYKGSQKNIAEIGRELDVQYVVEGSVRRSEDRFAATVQLVQVSDQTHLWTNRYEAELRDIFSTEGEIADAIAARIGGARRRETRKPTEDLEAYKLYIQGRQHLERSNLPEAVVKAKQYFEEAVARDPQFALAFDSLAELYWLAGFIGFMPPKETLSTGIFHALRAIEIDNTLAETHALLGQYRKQLDFDWAEVRREMNRALELNPASPVVRLRYAVTGLMPHGRIEEAIGELEAALETDPLSRFARCWLAEMLGFGRHYDRGIEQARLVIAAEPDNYVGHLILGQLYGGKGMFAEAIAAQRKAAELSGGAPLLLGWLGLALAQGGQRDEARALLERLHCIARRAYVPPTSFAWIHLGLVDVDEAFTWMDRAIDVRDHMLTPIKSYWFLDPIRHDPRYVALLRRMNLKP